MTRRMTFGFLAGLLMLGGSPLAAQSNDVPEPSAEAALAWHLDAISNATLGPDRPEPVWRRSAAILEAASRLDPQESRFPRLRTLALAHIGDTDGAIASVKAYRKLAPGDRLAQVQLIRLYASKLETLDAKVEYLKTLLDKQDIPSEVRAQIAVDITSLLAQKSPEQAAAMARRAVEIYPLAQATRQYYAYVGREQPLQPRVAALLAVIQSDPNQPSYIVELANLLAANGLSDDSLQWFDLAVSLIMRNGAGRPPGFHNLLIDYASELIISGHLAYADTMLGQLLDEQPLDADACLLKLTVGKVQSEKGSSVQITDIAGTALTRRWNALHDDILAGKGATQPAATQPAATQAVGPQPGADQAGGAIDPGAKVVAADPAAVLEKLKEQDDPQTKNAVVGVAADLAWFELYFEKSPKDAARWIDLLHALLPADAPLLARLEGWKALDAGDLATARQLLAKVAAQDPLAELGLIKADQLEKKPVDAERVRKLLDEHRTGFVAAVLWAALRTDAIHPATRPAADQVAALLEKFPRQWLAVLDPRASNRIYSVRAEPVQTSIPFGSPVLVRVTLSNNSEWDITVGTDALLHPDLWFDAKILGVDQQVLEGAAYDQLSNQILIRAHTTATQDVRLDEGSLQHALNLAPGSSTTVNGDVLTNPMPMQDASGRRSEVMPGPGGGGAEFLRTFTYMGMSLTLPSGKQQIEQALASQSAVDRIHAIDLLAAYIRLARQPNVDEAVKAAAASLPAEIDRLRHDPSAPVAAWAGYVSARLSAPAAQPAIVTEMSKSADWSTRLLSMLAAGSMPAAQQRQLASDLASDADPDVKAVAASITDLTQEPISEPTTTPATEPTTEPSSVPLTQPAPQP
jgi:tetratricopeptide (TPR) repeat protein